VQSLRANHEAKQQGRKRPHLAIGEDGVVKLGCSKCRHNTKGCAQCRKWASEQAKEERREPADALSAAALGVAASGCLCLEFPATLQKRQTSL
jgi:hypothetical protein